MDVVTKAINDMRQDLFDELRDYVVKNMDEDTQVQCDEIFLSFQRECMNDDRYAAKPNKVRRKRKISLYNMFLSDEMKRIKSEEPALNGSEVMKKAICVWNVLSDSEKEAARDKYRAKTPQDPKGSEEPMGDPKRTEEDPKGSEEDPKGSEEDPMETDGSQKKRKTKNVSGNIHRILRSSQRTLKNTTKP